MVLFMVVGNLAVVFNNFKPKMFNGVEDDLPKVID